MRFAQKIKLLNGKDVWVKEITLGQYKTLVKSIYSEDDESFIYHSNVIIQENLNSDNYSEISVIDKVLILLQLKAISVEPDLKLKIKCEETKREFEHVAPIDSLIKGLVLTDCSKKVYIDDFIIDTSLIKAKDEHVFLEKTLSSTDIEKLFFYTVVSSIDKVTYKNKTIDFTNIAWDERVQIISRLPSKLSASIIDNIKEVEKTISQNKLLSVLSPYTNKIALELPLTTNIASLIRFIKLVYTENLTNLYTISYNLINRAGFSGDYLDSITPVESQVYWIYCQKQMQKESEQENSNEKGINLPRSRSEFT